MAPAGEAAGRNEPLCLIEVQHSGGEATPRREVVGEDNPLAPPNPSSWKLCPGDLNPGSRKGILKPYSDTDLRVWPEARRAAVEDNPPAEEMTPREPFVNPIGDVVVEKEVIPPETSAVDMPPAKRVSKFKQARMANKK